MVVLSRRRQFMENTRMKPKILVCLALVLSGFVLTFRMTQAHSIGDSAWRFFFFDLQQNGAKLGCYFTLEFQEFNVTGKASAVVMPVRTNLNADSIPSFSSNLRNYLESLLQEFDHGVSELSPDLCAPFNQEARQLEAQLTTMHKMVARMARSEDDLARDAAMWGMMVNFCDEAATRIGNHSGKRPNWDARQFLDMISATRHKCLRLQTRHS